MPRATQQQREGKKATAPAKDAPMSAGPAKAKQHSNNDSSASVTFAQRLAHPDLAIRTANLRRLSSFLHRSAPIPPTDLQKIYKGLFYLFWLSDKPLVQQQMAERLAAMQDGMRQSRWLDVVRGFWLMMRREWTGIDRLRLDKYMMWVRAMLNHSLRYMGRRGWDEAMVQQWVELMVQLPLANNQEQRGLFLHVADIFVTELGRVLDEDGVGAVEWAVVNRMLQPFWDVVSTCPDASMVKRVEEEVMEALYQLAADDKEEGRSALCEVMRANAASMADKLFALASDKSTLNKSRTRLYKLRDMWQSLQRKEEASAGQTMQHTAESAPAVAVGKKRKGAETAEVSKKAKKSKAAAKEAEADAEDEVPMLVELDESGQLKANTAAAPAPATTNKKRKAEVGDSSQSVQQQPKQAEPSKQRKESSAAKKLPVKAARKTEQVEEAAENGAVFADATEFEVPEFGHDESAEDTEEEDDDVEEDEDDMGAILRAEEETEEGHDSFTQDEGGSEEQPVDEAASTLVSDADDDGFMDADAFERAIEQQHDDSDVDDTPAPVTKKGKGKPSTAAAMKGEVKNGNQSSANGSSMNGHGVKAPKGKQHKQQVMTSEQDDEAEAEAQAEAEMEEDEQPADKKARKQANGKTVAATQKPKRTNNSKPQASEQAAPQEEKVQPSVEQQPTPQKKSSGKQKKNVQLQSEEARALPQEEKEQLPSPTTHSSSSPPPFVTPRLPNKSRSMSSTAAVTATTTSTTTTITTTTTATLIPSTPISTSTAFAPPSTPLTSRTPKRVSISLEHNRVQQFHHWKPMQVKPDDTPTNSRTAPRSALKRRSIGGSGDEEGAPAGSTGSGGSGKKQGSGVGGGDKGRMSLPAGGDAQAGDGRPAGSPRRPTAADFF